MITSLARPGVILSPSSHLSRSKGGYYVKYKTAACMAEQMKTV